MPEELQVRQAGIAAITDLGRRGLARRGVPVNGAADQYSAAVANILVGNPRSAPLIEITATGFALSTTRPVLVSVTGAPAEVTINDRLGRMWEPLCLEPGTTIRVAAPTGGLRCYLAVHGTIDAPTVSGSCAPDSLLGVGTQLATGATVGLRSDYRPVDHPVFRHPLFCLGAAPPRFPDPCTIDVTDGPDIAEFPTGRELLASATYAVTPRSNHIGLRLAGPMPPRLSSAEVLSRGIPVGAVEVPPSEELLVLQRGRPVTAGYPVIAVATKIAQDALGQLRPGQHLRFRYRTVADAVAMHRARQHRLRTLANRVCTVFAALGISCRTA
ncbi:biotin-dependent carboxyltransferase family protein [Saccharopolyspora spinosa]|uniref:Biotin-dependent carboxylase-like uncharacterized protein n=1 Tax=Saccharopolyspora spinosa TaxID=60894 RepID=A0A2N3Y5R0_SACSN|nr:biotin-dependent carboxyltransferase family protein [Saccharopolyspora spinosa]PKW18223.1 biotin-dependent carboxylase-like uncharacterized protein [Saccharopolyspora spinosa]